MITFFYNKRKKGTMKKAFCQKDNCSSHHISKKMGDIWSSIILMWDEWTHWIHSFVRDKHSLDNMVHDVFNIICKIIRHFVLCFALSLIIIIYPSRHLHALNTSWNTYFTLYMSHEILVFALPHIVIYPCKHLHTLNTSWYT